MAISFPVPVVPVTRVDADWVHQGKVSVDVLRADLVDAELSGNKYFKLMPNLQLAREQGHTTLLSFGGPWSNHLHALAAAGARFGFQTVGVVRGEQVGELTPTLADAARWGMRLHFVSRADYDRKDEADWLQALVERVGRCYLIPEGGCNRAGVLGCRHLLPATGDYTHVMLACGTGATMAGLVTVSQVPVTGIQVLKAEGYLQREVQRLLQEHGLAAMCDWRVLDQWHGGGYARISADLAKFMRRFEADTGVPLDPVYSAKLMQAATTLIQDDFFPANTRLLVIHGGGLQGRRSMA